MSWSIMALSQFKTEHHYVAGLALTLIGITGIAGSITGRLASMLAGLFDANDLQSTGTQPNNPVTKPGTPGGGISYYAHQPGNPQVFPHPGR